jgi:hypothetical protein
MNGSGSGRPGFRINGIQYNSNCPQLEKEFSIWGKYIGSKKRFSLTPVDPRTSLHSNIYSISDTAGANHVVFWNAARLVSKPNRLFLRQFQKLQWETK